MDNHKNFLFSSIEDNSALDTYCIDNNINYDIYIIFL